MLRLLIVLLLAVTLLAPASLGAELVVAAADASPSDRAAADIRCDGIDDQRDINNAFNSLPNETGTVRLTVGTFNCSESIFPNGGCELIGAGQGLTKIVVLNSANTNKPISITQPDVHLRGFTLMGNGGVMVRVSRVVVEEVTATNRGSDGQRYPAGTNGLFYIWADGQTIEDVVFINCTAEDGNTHGFSLNAINLPRETRNISFVNCVARRCGFGVAGGSRSEWITGFDIQENNDLFNVQVINCRAEDNWQSGFHFEPGGDTGTAKEAITFQGCTAERNGQRNPQLYPYTSTFLSGFYVHFNAVLTDCTSINNKNAGFYVEGGDNVVFTRCTDLSSTYGWKVVKNARNIRLEDCASSGAEKWAFWSAFATNITLARFRQVDAGGEQGYQSMLGWYYDNPSYQLPVTCSSFEITAAGDRSLGIINEAGSGNTYVLQWDGNTTLPPTASPTVTPTPISGPPVAAFTVNATTGPAPLAVKFTDASSGMPTNWSWTFGDGGSSSEQSPVHMYASAGTYTVRLSSTNGFGSDSTNQTIIVTGATAPASVTNLHVMNATTTSITWAWTDPIDAAFERVRVYKNGATVGYVNKSVQTYTLTGLSPNTWYTLYTRTYDIAGNFNATTVNKPGKTAALDATPPASVTSLHVVNTTATTITWNWTDPTDSDFTKVRVYKNGATIGYVDKGVQTFTMTGLSPSTWYTLNTRTYDGAGNYNATTVNKVGKTAAPSDTTPPASVTNLHVVSSTPTSITWTWTDPTDGDFAKVRVYKNSATVGYVNKSIQSYTMTGLSPNTWYTLNTRTYDSAGNYNASTVNRPGKTAAPDITPPASVTNLHVVDTTGTTITWAWTDPTDADFTMVRVYKNGATIGYVEKGAQTYTMTGLSPGTWYTLYTRTYDTAGNYNASTVNNPGKTAVIRIVPLGDSITRGGNSVDSPYLSYRYYLYDSLQASGYGVDFVGSLSSAFAGSNFDQQHEGHGGYTIGGIVDGVDTGGKLSTWLGGYYPDMALVLIGTNDVLQQTPMATRFENLGRLVDTLRAKNPEITIYLGTLPPTGDSFRNQNSGLIEFNGRLPGWAAEKSSSGSRIVVVDLYSGYDGSTDNQPDGIHPDESGEQKIAARWYNAII